MYVASINIKNKREGNIEGDLSYGLSIFLLLICFANMVIVPIVIICFHRRGELDTERRQRRCGFAYLDLNYKIRGYWALLYPFFQNLRFVILVYVTLYMEDYLICQLILMSLSTIFIMAVLSNRPLRETKQNYLFGGLAGEAFVLAIQDLLLFATDPQVIPEDRQQIGMVIIIVVSANIVFAIGILTTESLKETVRQCKMRKTRHDAVQNALKMMKERRAAKASRPVPDARV